MNNHTEAEDTPIAHYHRPDGITCSLNPNSDRAAAWLKVFHRTDGIPLTSFYAVEEKLPEVGYTRVYMLDLTRITGAERARLITYIVQRFNVAAHIVDEDLDREGYPILTEDVTVAIPI
jgi:hypothetical protein